MNIAVIQNYRNGVHLFEAFITNLVANFGYVEIKRINLHNAVDSLTIKFFEPYHTDNMTFMDLLVQNENFYEMHRGENDMVIYDDDNNMITVSFK